MSRLEPMPRVDVDQVLVTEREALLDLLAGLDDADWSALTECPAWTVEGVALHILGDDLSLLARQRDDAIDGLTLYAETHPGLSLYERLDRFNEQWVVAATFLSHTLILDLLELTGRWTASFYAEIDKDKLGEPVGMFAAQEASPYWQIAAREYLERWIHQHQIRRAVGRPDAGREFLTVAGDVVAHMIAAHGRGLEAVIGSSIVFDIPSIGAWTVEHEEAGWAVFRGAADAPTAIVVVDAGVATPMLSRALPASEVASQLQVTGDDRLSHAIVDGFSLLAGRP